MSKFQDIFVTDYLDKGKLSPELRELLAEPPWLQEYRDHLYWRLAHLTLKRLNPNQPRPTRVQFEHLNRLITMFLTALPEKQRTLNNPNQQG